jgi:hypothetical protein
MTSEMAWPFQTASAASCFTEWPDCARSPQAAARHLFPARLKPLLLQGQRLAENESARTRKAAHGARLSAVGHRFVLEGWQSLHGRHDTFYIWAMRNETGVRHGFRHDGNSKQRVTG